MLGPVSLRGAAQPFHRAIARDLVVYLAFHREGVTHGEWALALWPDRPVSSATVHSTASDARRALGRASDGAARLPCGPRLRLDPSVVTDVDRFVELAHAGAPEGGIEAAGLLRGPLFAGMQRMDWAVLDGTLARVESLVVHGVLRGAETLLRAGRLAESEWLVRRGLVVSPYDERIYRALLRVLAAQGNRLGLRAVMAQLLLVARDAPAPPGWGPDSAGLERLHPETTALYRDLMGSWPATGGVAVRL